MTTAPATFLQALAPYRQGLVVAVECLVTGAWRAALWADQGSPCVRGHALDRQAIHGGQATHDPSDSHKSAQLWRGGRLPQTSGAPAQRPAPRDLLRRRMPLTQKRAARLAPVHKTKSQYPRPAMGKQSASKAKRDGVAERCADPAVPKSLAVDLALIPYDDALLRAVALSLLTTARHHDAHPL